MLDDLECGSDDSSDPGMSSSERSELDAHLGDTDEVKSKSDVD